MKIKICGLTSPAEAEYLNRNHVDFAGIVMFFPKSRRNTSPEQAAEIIRALDPYIKKVAVTVSPSLEQALAIEALGFDYIQVHGKLNEELLENIKLPILKAFNINDMDSCEFYQSCPQIAGCVFDAQEPGSGRVFDWDLIKIIPRNEKLFILAGGLNAENVSDAIVCVRPDCVDVSSGVEFDGRPGKDPFKIDRFVHAVRS